MILHSLLQRGTGEKTHTADRKPNTASSTTAIVYACEQSCQLHGALGIIDRSYKLYPDARYTDRDYGHKPLGASDTKLMLSLGAFPKQSIQ